MYATFPKERLKLDEVSYDIWKENVKTHFLCMGLCYWLITKILKDVMEENKLEGCDEAQKDVFMFNMSSSEALLSTPLETKFSR